MPDLLLASASPRRRLLLGYLGLELSVLPASIDETPLSDESPEALVKRLSGLKARASLQRYGTAPIPVLAADTVVVLDGHILGKPSDKDHALKMWYRLAGNVHTVTTGYTILAPDGRSVSRCVTSEVEFKHLSDEELHAYLKTDEWRDKAGGYAVQGMSGMWIKSIRGSYTNVMGLPLAEVSDDLRALMNWPAFPWTE